MPPPPAEQLAARIFVGPALRAQPDRRLVDLVRDGYDAAFEEIVRRYRKPLDRFAAGIVGTHSEDVTQDSLSKALLALRHSEAEIELRPWLYRIVRNTALNDLRDRAPTAEELSERMPGARSAAADAEAREELRELMQRLQALPEPQRAALVMRELEGHSHEEIAAALGVSGGAARQAIYRARAALREGLGLLVPLPALRLAAEHGAEMVKAGGATVLVAGTVGAGVVIDHHRGERPGPEAAVAAPPVATERSGGAAEGSPPGGASSGGAPGRNLDTGGSAGGGRRADDAPSGGKPSAPDRSENSGSGGGSNDAADGPRHSGSDSGGPGPGSGPQGESGSSDDRHGGSGGGGGSGPSAGSEDSGGSGGSGSEDGSSVSGGSGSDGGSSGSGGGTGSDGGPTAGEAGGSGSGDGEIEPEPTTSEPTLVDSGDGRDGGPGDSSGETSSGSDSSETVASSDAFDGSP